jgi:hypothetical protein
MFNRLLLRLFAACALATATTSCESTTRSGYEAAATRYEQRAWSANRRAEQQEVEAQVLERLGDEANAEASKEAALAASRQAWIEQLQADRVHWLSQWWPSLPYQ